MKTAPDTDNWQEVKAVSEAALPREIVEHIERCRRSPHPESQLIGVLHKVQGHFGHLGGPQLDAVAQLLGVPAAKVTGVATFYHFFRLSARGQFVISVCMGTACYVRGADKVAQKLREELGIGFGETTKDGLFSLDQTRCLGTCGLAPVLMVNEEIIPNVTPDQVPGLLEKYAAQARAKAAAGPS